MMDQILEWCKGVIGIADDVVIYGDDDDEDHDQNLHNFMHRAQEHGLVFNGEKCEVMIGTMYHNLSSFSTNLNHIFPGLPQKILCQV